MSEEMTVTEALREAQGSINTHNAGYADKIVLFYYIGPYSPGTSGYIHWVLGSDYTARHQMMGAQNMRTCWQGTPPCKYFLDTLLTDMLNLRRRMIDAVTVARLHYDYMFELEAYRASDEVDKIDRIFYEI